MDLMSASSCVFTVDLNHFQLILFKKRVLLRYNLHSIHFRVYYRVLSRENAGHSKQFSNNPR